MITCWHRFKEVKPSKNTNYICCCLLSDFRGGDYCLDQIILKYDVNKKMFDCDSSITVLYWSDCPEWPLSLPLDPDEDDKN